MLLEYTNRKGFKHYLRAVTTPKGGTRYYIVKNLEKFAPSDLLTAMPDDYEFHEIPDNAQVVIHKKITPIFTLQEKEVIDNVMKQHDTITDFILELTPNSLVIHVAHLDREDFSFFSDDDFIMAQSYTARMVFTKKEKQYTVHRKCYLSFAEDWIPLETSSDLYELAKKFTFHIGKDSLLSFWIEGEEDF